MAREFTASSDEIRRADSATLNPAQSNSMYAQVWLDSYGISGESFKRNIFSDETAASANPSLIFRIGSSGGGGASAEKDKIGVNYVDASNHDIQSTGVVGLGGWHPIGFTTDGTDIRFYIDGVLDSTKAYTITPTQKGDDWGIGFFSTSNERTWDGKLAWLGYHVGITLSDGQMREAAERGWVAEGLTALYPLLGNASPEPDWGGNTLNMTTITGTVVADNPPTAPPFGFGLGWQGAFTAAAGGGGPARRRVGIGAGQAIRR